MILRRFDLRLLRLTLRREGKIGKIVLRALSVSSDDVRFFCLQKRERLRARAIRVHTHPGLLNRKLAKQRQAREALGNAKPKSTNEFLMLNGFE